MLPKQCLINVKNLLSLNIYLETGAFYLENQINEQEAKDLVELTIKRLQQVDQPSLSKYTHPKR